MAYSPEYRDHILDLLAPLAHVAAKRMFGGVGFFYRDLMFALIARDHLFFKVDDRNLADFEAAGSEAFSYTRGDKVRALKSYWRVPDEVMDNEDDFLDWARRAVDAALAADKAKAASGKKLRRSLPEK